MIGEAKLTAKATTHVALASLEELRSANIAATYAVLEANQGLEGGMQASYVV